MPPQPPSFGSQEYWERRFKSNSDPFEWLEAPTVLDSYMVEAIEASSDAQPELLHIGCGTSLLSYHLRAHIKTPEQIHNVDYSDVAIKIGKQWEIDMFDMEDGPQDVEGLARLTPHVDESKQGVSVQDQITPYQKSRTRMRWSAANLLSHSSLLDVCQPSTYSLIVDKSTSDSIACADDIYVPLPYILSTSTREPFKSELPKCSGPIHPLHVLAIHMALLAKPRARWIALSYSEDRFPFLPTKPNTANLRAASCSSKTESSQAQASDTSEGDDFDNDDLDNIAQEMVELELPDPGILWRLLGKYEIEAPIQEPSKGSSVTHRPKVMHWIYVLERTDVEVFVRKPYDTKN